MSQGAVLADRRRRGCLVAEAVLDEGDEGVHLVEIDLAGRGHVLTEIVEGDAQDMPPGTTDENLEDDLLAVHVDRRELAGLPTVFHRDVGRGELGRHRHPATIPTHERQSVLDSRRTPDLQQAVLPPDERGQGGVADRVQETPEPGDEGRRHLGVTAELFALGTVGVGAEIAAEVDRDAEERSEEQGHEAPGERVLIERFT